MKKRIPFFLCALLLLTPLSAAAESLPEVLGAVSQGLSEGLEIGAKSLAAPDTDLTLTLEADDTRLEEGGTLKRLYGTRLQANSSHHQAVDRVGRGLRVVALSPDGVVEGLEHQSLPVLGVQFHPERMEKGLPIFELFLKRCRVNP